MKKYNWYNFIIQIKSEDFATIMLKNLKIW
jgi:hypothetical protein